jgi:8-oxo-dGTP diphosphatase
MQDLWEFPGGKVENGESACAALRRELAEELGIDELEIEHFQRVEYDYPDLHVTLDFFIVCAWKGTPQGIEGQRLRWIDADELDAGRILPADVPVIAAIKAIG